jgi:Dyp-type peroxidase family
MDTLELADIQGYIIRGYANMQYSRFVLLKIEDAAKAKTWLREITDSLTVANVSANSVLPDTALNIAFTSPGLLALGMLKENLSVFTPEFREGMVTAHRGRLLNDFDASAPEHWTWGGPKNDPTHAVLMIFGKDRETCLAYYENLRNQYTGNGYSEQKLLDGQTLANNKEHFGFRDGISQPIIKGSGRTGPEWNMVNPGEFILGYRNEYNVYPDSPLLKKEQGAMNLLATDAAGSGIKDLGRNSSYLVIRQMEQNVNAFWTFMNEQTKNDDGSINEAESTKLAAKMIGRWPSGAPVTKFPDQDPGSISDDNDFGYAATDKDGLKCPLGAHLRRCNPRDSFEDDDKKESIKLSNRHRIIRRARLYGDPFIGSPVNKNPDGEVGLLFNCFNADISRQFELIQHTWANSTKVKNFYSDPDPLIGVRDVPFEGMPQNFTIQGCPVNKTITGLQRFVKIRGGAYFFFPSITATRYLATL